MAVTLIDTLRAAITAKIAERATKQAELDAVIATPETEARDLNADEATRFAELRDALKAIDAELTPLEERVSDLQAEADRRDAIAKRAKESGAHSPAKVLSEARTYRQQGNHSFLSDAYAAEFGGSYEARDRLAQHMKEESIESRAVGTGAFAGLTIPQYLVDEFAPLARAGRPAANAVRSATLPSEGMTISLSRITTGTATGVQATENSAVQNTDIDDTKLDVPVVTIAGQQDVSRQALERSTNVEQVIMGDLLGDYAVRLDGQVLNGSGVSGQALGILQTAGINAVTYTDASPTVGEFYAKLADAVQRVPGNRYLPATGILMHPRRWGWLMAALDTTNRPLVLPAAGAPSNAAGVGSAAEYGQVVGQMLGLPVITDANVPTTLGGGTEDIVIVGRLDDAILWEEASGPKQLRFDATTAGSLQVKVVVYGYAAFTAGRYPAGISTVGGTGLIAPTF
jgi:HK97 family phage major capsid protein